MNKSAITPVNRKEAGLAVARLIPYIMRGTQLEFFVKRGVTQTQFLVLNAIRVSTRCTMSALAENLHVSMPTISGIVDRLVRGSSGLRRRLSEREEGRHRLLAGGHRCEHGHAEQADEEQAEPARHAGLTSRRLAAARGFWS